MLDAEVHEPIIALTLDGAGYAPDGTIWGGEILFSYFDRYKHVGTLEQMPLIGGDMAVHHPKRLVFGIYENLGLNSDELGYFTSGEAEVYRNIIKTSPQTSSLGRMLDSLSCYFGIATKRTYDGEPAMKLERYLAMGEPKYDFKTNLETTDEGLTVIKTLPLFKQLFEYVAGKDPIKLSNTEKANLCHSFINELMKNFVKIAYNEAQNSKSNYIGLSGGVTHNLPIVEMVESEIKNINNNLRKKEKIRFLTHVRLPNGDGCISTGQNIITGHMQGEDLNC
jgi:hydrogenase maturation protein HypF